MEREREKEREIKIEKIEKGDRYRERYVCPSTQFNMDHGER